MKLKSVNYYKLSLMKGCLHNLTPDRQLNLELSDNSYPGTYISAMFDTRDEDMTFNRLCIEAEYSNSKLEVIVAATNMTEAVIENSRVSLQGVIENPQVNALEKRELLLSLPHIRKVNTEDMLLHTLKGRYVFIYVCVYPTADSKLSFAGMRLELPKEGFTEYFPEIYQGDEFFERFIGVFQSMYLDMEKRVDRIPMSLDYENTDEESLRYLAGWLGIEDKEGLFTPNRLRHIIANIDLFQGGKGTVVALQEVIFLVCGIRPKIVEHFVWSKLALSSVQREHMGELYGETSNHFCVIIDITKLNKPFPVERRVIEKLIESYSMIGTQYKLVFLKQCSHTDTHCHLDINSCLSTPEALSLGEASLGSNISLGARR